MQRGRDGGAARRLRLAALAVVAAPLLAPTPAAAEIVVGPHVQDLRADGVTLIWEQDDAAPATLVVDGAARLVASDDPVREVRLTGLPAGTRHGYTVRAGGAERSGSFVTAPADPRRPLRFVVYGDTRTRHEHHAKVVRAIVADGPFDFAIHTGDMVQDGGDRGQWRRFFEIEAPLVATTPWFPVIGNHELDGKALSLDYYRLLAPPRVASGTETYYAFTVGNSAFVVLDGYVHAVGRRAAGWWPDYDDAQRAWLEWVLATYEADDTIEHVFVATHRPPYSSLEKRTGCHALRLLQPRLAAKGVAAIFAGHDHYLERGEAPSGLRYFVLGGGGAPLYDNSSIGSLGLRPARAEPWRDDARTVRFAAKTLGYAVVTVEGPDVAVEIKGVDRRRLDRVQWRRGAR